MTTRLTLEGTGSYLHLFQPKAVGNAGDPKYSMQLVFDPGYDYNNINAAIQEAIQEKFGANVPANLHLPVSDPMQNPKLASNAFYHGGKYYINCNATQENPPELVDKFGQKIIDPSQLYSGCRVVASVSFYGYDTMGNRGVAVGLNAVMKLADGDRLDNRPDAKTVFADYIQDAPQGAPQQAPQGYAPQGAPQGAPQQAPQGYAPQQAPQGAPQQAPQGAPQQSFDPATGQPINPQYRQ